MRSQPTTTLLEQASTKIEQAFPDRHSGTVRVIWWDDGGYLADVVRFAAEELGIGFRAAERFPLDLRVDAVTEESSGDALQVWYIGEAKEGRDWFRDIRETGGEIECGLEELTAELYEVDPWEIFDVERRSSDAREQAAGIIKERFASAGIPRYDNLREEIITKGKGEILDHLLRGGWPEIDRDSETVADVRDRLRENHSIPLDADAGPEEITTQVRRWAVAQWLMAAGVDQDLFPAEIVHAGYNPLKELLNARGTIESAKRYLEDEFWSESIDELGAAREYAECPVDGALDAALWQSWTARFDAGDTETCIGLADSRREAVSLYGDESPWVRLWSQAEHLARLHGYLTEWEDRAGDVGPFEQYADVDGGSWRIDGEVLKLQLTGRPEETLPTTHPATTTLAERRDELLVDRYRAYLETLAEEVTATVQVETPFIDQDSAHTWWRDHEDEFQKAGTVAILLIDALRFDLAQELARRLGERFEVKQDIRRSMLPSETRFGMAALTPGRSFRFSLLMKGGTLVPEQGGRSLRNKTERVKFLDEQGWDVPSEPKGGWAKNRIVYHDKELDDVGEGEIGDITAHFQEYIDDLVELIDRKLEKENWERIYVVTDHGFVLFPEKTTMEAVDADSDDVEVKYRRVAGDGAAEAAGGVHLPATTPGLDYLDTDLRLLVDPRQHYSKQSYNPSRYYHGGLLPQECMLSFLSVRK